MSYYVVISDVYVCVAGKHCSVSSLDILALVTNCGSNINSYAYFSVEMEIHNMKFEIKMKRKVGKERTAC
jgi:hypothetical protein